jgi:hypothetical protein
MPKRRTIIIALTSATSLVALASAAATFRPDQALRAASASVARTLCGETFVSGLDPDQSFREMFTDFPGIGLLQARMLRKVERDAHSVTVSLDGLFESRAVFRQGYGCDLEYPGMQDRSLAASPPQAALDQPDPWDLGAPVIAAPADPRLAAAIDEAFAEPPGRPQRATKAIIVIHKGRIVAERYAPGYGRYAFARLLGFEIRGQCADRHIGAAREAEARRAGSGRGLGEPLRSAPRHHHRRADAQYQRARHRRDE